MKFSGTCKDRSVGFLLLFGAFFMLSGFVFTQDPAGPGPIIWQVGAPPEIRTVRYFVNTDTLELLQYDVANGRQPQERLNAVINGAAAWNGKTRIRLEYGGTTDSFKFPPAALLCLLNPIDPIVIVSPVPTELAGLSQQAIHIPYVCKKKGFTGVEERRHRWGSLIIVYASNLQSGSPDFIPWNSSAAGPGATEYDLQSVMTHEFGHLVGLSHPINAAGLLGHPLHTPGGNGPNCDTTSLPSSNPSDYDSMCFRNRRGQTWQRTIETDDVSGIRYLYDRDWSIEDSFDWDKYGMWLLIIGGVMFFFGLFLLIGLFVWLGAFIAIFGAIFYLIHWISTLSGPDVDFSWSLAEFSTPSPNINIRGIDMNVDVNFEFCGLNCGPNDKGRFARSTISRRDIVAGSGGSAISLRNGQAVGNSIPMTGVAPVGTQSIRINGQQVQTHETPNGVAYASEVPTPDDGTVLIEYVDSQGNVTPHFRTVTRADLAVQGVSLPTSTQPNTPIVIDFSVREIRNEAGATATIELRDGESVVGFQEVFLESGANTMISFPVEFSAEGQHDLTLELKSISPDDVEPSNNKVDFSVDVSAAMPSLPISFDIESVTVPANQSPYRLSSADLDSDGADELFIGHFFDAGQALIYPGVVTDGSTLTFGATVPVGANGTVPAGRDIDGDSLIDYLFGSANSGWVSVWRNLSTGPGDFPLETPTSYYGGGNNTDLAFADFDGDGIANDIAIANRDARNFGLLRNTSTPGAISFDPVVYTPTSVRPEAIGSGDFDGDGRPDVVLTSNTNENDVFIYRNTTSADGPLSFELVAQFAAFSPRGLDVSDIDRDGKLDILVAVGGSMVLYTNESTGPGDFSFGSMTFGSNFVYDVVSTADFNNDGWVDVAAISENGFLRIFENVSAGASEPSFEIRVEAFVSGTPRALTHGDFNGDGREDLAVAPFTSDRVHILRNNMGD